MSHEESLPAMAARARPARVVSLDIGQPLPELRADDRYRDACVVLCQGGVPRGLVMIELAPEADRTRDQLRGLIAQLPETDAGLSTRPTIADDALPRISVVVPTIVERTEDIERCIDGIGLLDYPNFEVVVVDNRRTLPARDPLPELVRNRPWLRVVREARPGISAARNAGVAQTNGDVVAFTDDDVRVDSQWLRAIGTRLALNPSMEAVTGLILPAELETSAQIWFERYYGGFGGLRTFDPVILESPHHAHVWMRSQIAVRDPSGLEIRRLPIYGVGAFVAGANMAIRKSTLERIGGFDVDLGTGTPARGGEDLAAMISILWTGGQIGYEPAAFVYHKHRREYSELLTQMDGYGLGYTAMLTSLVRNDPHHALGLASQIPMTLGRMAAQGAKRIRHQNVEVPTVPEVLYPRTLARREHRAYLRGPSAYARSRRMSREHTPTAKGPAD